MFAMLDVAIGLAFTYLLLSLLCTAINEWVATLFQLRSKTLVHALARLVNPDGPETRAVAHPILSQPEIRALSPKIDHPPSYIPRAVFVRAAQRAKLVPERTEDEWGELFDATMDRATGWYKRRLQFVSTLVAIGLTVLAQADTLRIVDRLWRAPVLREQFVAAAQHRVQDEATRRVVADYENLENAAPGDSESAAESVESAEHVGDEDARVPDANEQELLSGVMGWGLDFRTMNADVCRRWTARRDAVCGAGADPKACAAVLDSIAADPRCTIVGATIQPTDAWPGRAFGFGAFFAVLLRSLVGWLLTVAAISLGAPFWFDTLSRFVNIRGTGKAPVDPDKTAVAASVSVSAKPAGGGGR